MSEELKHKIYSATECLSEQTMFDYIDNKLSAKERHIVEKHMLDCELCQDAMEGLELVKDRNRISIINKIIDERIIPSTEKEAKIVSINYKIIFSIAAGIALLIGGIFFFKNITSSEMKNSDVAELKQLPPPPPPAPADKTATGESENIPSAEKPSDQKNKEEQFQSPADLRQTVVTSADTKEQSSNKNFKGTLGTTSTPGNLNESNNNPANGAVMTDAITRQEDDKIVTTPAPVEIVDVSKNAEKNREINTSLDETKKSEEKPATQTVNNTAPSSYTYAWSPSTEKPDQKQKRDKSNSDNSGGDELVLAKKSEKENQSHANAEGKDKDKKTVAKEYKGAEDAAAAKVITAEPQMETTVSDKEEVAKTETKTPAATGTVSANTTVVNNTTKAGYFNYRAADSVYTIVEKMPEYPGGDLEMNKFIAANLKYPAKDDEGNIIATVNIQFIINAKGKVTSSKLVTPKSLVLEKQVIALANKMPLWKPGKQSGKDVSVKYYATLKVLVK
ncbi:MAG: energy transducer TonB [Bacteroidia bacterium]